MNRLQKYKFAKSHQLILSLEMQKNVEGIYHIKVASLQSIKGKHYKYHNQSFLEKNGSIREVSEVVLNNLEINFSSVAQKGTWLTKMTCFI